MVGCHRIMRYYTMRAAALGSLRTTGLSQIAFCSSGTLLEMAHQLINQLACGWLTFVVILSGPGIN